MAGMTHHIALIVQHDQLYGKPMMQLTRDLSPEAHGLQSIQTDAVRKAMTQLYDQAVITDLLFLESWEIGPIGSIAATLRAAQIRRANAGLAARIREEVLTMRGASFCHTDALRAASVRFSVVPRFGSAAI